MLAFAKAITYGRVDRPFDQTLIFTNTLQTKSKKQL